MEYKELYEMAVKAMENAYAPYSKFKVGAALLTKEGEVFTGCNVENSSYGATICAERTAITKAVSEGYQDYIALAVCGSDGDFAAPCGICRQVIYEFSDDMDIILGNDQGEMKTFKIKELLPEGFRLNERNII